MTEKASQASFQRPGQLTLRPDGSHNITRVGIPSYSVVTPVYNAAKTLVPMIEALLRLDPPPRAIYLVDDGSTDGSPDIVQRYPAVTCVPLSINRGPGHARNVGARIADTELLLMIDSDCYIDPDTFHTAYARLASTQRLAGIMGVPVRETPPGPFAGVFKNYWYHLEFKEWGDPPRTLYGSLFLIRRDAYLSVGGFDESFGRIPCEDAEFYFRLVQAGHVFERRMDFLFIHHKSMTLRQLIHTSFERSVSIIQNLRGKLGQQGVPWKLHEKVRWAIEIGCGTAGVVGLPVAAAAALGLAAGASHGLIVMLAAIAVGSWLACLLLFFVCIHAKLVFAFKDKGLVFATRAFIYRMLEMPAVALGIVWGSLPRHATKSHM